MIKSILHSHNSYRVILFFTLLTINSCKENLTLEKEIDKIQFEVKVERFDKLFMNSNKEKFLEYKVDFPFLFPKHIPDSVLFQRTKDPVQKLIKKSVDSVFFDFNSIEDNLVNLFKHIKYYNPFLRKPRLITVFSDVDYRNKVIVTDTIVLIGIDNYLGSEHPFYQGFFKYIRKKRN